MNVTATELKLNLGKYLLLAATQDTSISPATEKPLPNWYLHIKTVLILLTHCLAVSRTP